VLSVFFQVRFRILRTIDESNVLVHHFLLVAGKILWRAKVYGNLNFCFTKLRVRKSCKLYQPLRCYFRTVAEMCTKKKEFPRSLSEQM
jgi:hypothetical protein